MSEWKEVKLGDVCEVKGGKRLPKGHNLISKKTTHPYIRVRDLNINGYSIKMNNIEYISEETFKYISKYTVNCGDIILSNVGTIGLIAEIDKRLNGANLTENCVKLTNFKNIINSKYLKYYLLSTYGKEEIKKQTVGAVQPKLAIFRIKDIKIKLPPLPIQKKIADILSVIDEKIETLQNINETLEEMAKAIFKSWFVDFDIVKAKEKGKSDSEIAKEFGISEEIVKLFPSEFVESEIGMIPRGWKVGNFGAFLIKHIGGDWGKDEKDNKHNQKVRIIRGTDIPKIKNLDFQSIPTRFVENKKLQTRRLEDGDIIIEISGGTKGQPTGRSLYITNKVIEKLGGLVEPASFCRLFKPINKEIGLILYYHLLYIYDKGKMWSYQNQSTGISNFQTKYFLEEEKVVIPSDDILNIFSNIVRNMIDRIYLSEKPTLQELRDTLLPKLINGKIEVNELNIKGLL